MIVLLLNISYIPDEVARKINFKAGWSKEFKKDMEEYKRKFYERTNRNWEFQNSRLEDDYIHFFRDQQKTDVDYIQEKTAEAFDTKFAVYFKRIKDAKNADGQGDAIN